MALAVFVALQARAADKRAQFENAVLDEQSAVMPTGQQVGAWLKVTRAITIDGSL